MWPSLTMSGRAVARLAALTTLLLTSSWALATPMQRVVILYDERPELPGLAILDRGITDTLDSHATATLEVYREAMDLSRFRTDTHLSELRDHLAAKYSGKRIDVVIAVMGPALDFLARNKGVVFPGASIVFCGIDRRELDGRVMPADVTGVLLKREFAPTLELALALHRDTEHVVFVAGASEFDSRLVEQAKEELRPYESRVELRYLTALPLAELLTRLSRLPPRSVVLYSTLFRDGAGESFVPHEAAEKISAAANAPVYGFLDQYLGRGIVGGHLYSVGAHGEQAARLALRILAGASPRSIAPVEAGASTTQFDARQLARWNIAERSLPPDATVAFREPTLWAQYREYVLATGLVLLAQSLLIGALLLQIVRRRRAEITLRESEIRYRTTADSSPMMIWLSSSVHADQFFNRSWLEFTGGTPEQNVADGWTSRLHPDDMHRSREQYLSAFAAREPFEIECRLRRHDGDHRWMLCRGAPRYGAKREFLGYVCSAIDVEERKQIEGAHRHLAHAARLATMGELTALVAHEVKQPLSAILSNTEAAILLLDSNRAPTEKLHAILTDIRRDTLRADAAIRSIRTLVREQEFSLAACDLNDCIVEVLRLVSSDAQRHGAEIHTRLAEDLPPAYLDRIHVQQVLLNLIVNAMEAMSGVAAPRRVVICTRLHDANSACVSVSDNGPGIPAAMLDNVFDSFVTTKRDGTGLGLRIARTIVDNHGGRIWATNEAEGGATLAFTLPLAQTSAAIAGEQEAALEDFGNPDEVCASHLAAAGYRA
jgi:PAS domain S-box-containing protein